tara:strand:+ start:2220 stop:2987 length:768 start_codon:yes stop_codon:yes gene_type:complete
MAHIVSEFYHDIQFPGHYTQEEVIKKTTDFYLEEFLDLSHLPFKGKILEAGCGSGYTTHVIANVRRDVEITGTDFSKGSLEFATTFTNENNYKNTKFQWMDLREIDLKENSFDMLICSGVLHHIENPRLIFTKLSNLVKKNGTIIIGLYHPWGRFSIHARQKIFRITGGKMKWIDPRLRNENWTEHRKNAWFRDQYEHPHEETYDHQELLKWFKEEEIEFTGSIPKFDGSDFSYNVYMITRTGSQGGLFIFVGKK